MRSLAALALASIAVIALSSRGASAYNAAEPFGPTRTTWSLNVGRDRFAHEKEGDAPLILAPPHYTPEMAKDCSHVDPQSIFMHKRRCVNGADLRFNVENDQLKHVTLNFIFAHHDFEDKGWGVPGFDFQLWNEAGTEKLASTRTDIPKEGHTTVDWPEQYRMIQNLPTAFQIRLVFDAQTVSTYVYEFPESIPPEIFESKVSYDLVPQNNTMGTHFMIKITDDKLSVWVQRKPPVPPFFLSVIHHDAAPRSPEDGGHSDLAHLYVEPQLYTSNAFGLDYELDESSRAELMKGRVTLVVHFLERPRETTAEVVIPNLRETLRMLPTSSSKKVTLSTNVANTAVRLVYHPETKFVGLHVLQPEPIENVEISLERAFSASSRQLLLRESDAIIPYYPHDSPVQYGWYDAIPSAEEAMRNDKNEDVLDGNVVITVRFDRASHTHDDQHSSTTPAPAVHMKGRLLKRWSRLIGAHAERLDLDPVFAAGAQLTVTAPQVIGLVRKGEVIASVPYNAFLPYSKLENTTWAQLVTSKAHAHSQHVRSNNLHPEADRFLVFAAVILGHLFEETTNYRVQFDTFRSAGPRLPVSYTPQELALFDFEPAIKHEVARMKQLWDVEFRVLTEMATEGHLPVTFTREQFDTVRSHLETRLINISAQLTLTPLVDLLPHDDLPSVQLKFDDEENEVEMVATRDLGSDALGRRVTMDLGKSDKTMVEFLLQHGVCPTGARHAVHWLLPGDQVRQLEASKESKEELLELFPESTSKLSSFCQQIKEKHDVLQAPPPKGTAPGVSATVAELATRLRQAQAEIVMWHFSECRKEKYY